MPPSRSWLARARRALSDHVDRLHDTLATLSEQLRATVAQAVTGTVAGAVRETVHALLTDETPARARAPYVDRPPYRPPCWGARDPYDRAADADDPPPEDWPEDRAPAWRAVAYAPPERTRPAETTEPGRARWHGAVAVGCQAAAWWLRRQAGRVSALAALGLGVLAAGAAFAAGVGLAESALTLLGLADALRSGTHALASLSET